MERFREASLSLKRILIAYAPVDPALAVVGIVPVVMNCPPPEAAITESTFPVNNRPG
jgi:hypothetical protein